MKYLSTFEAAEKWGISHRHVNILYSLQSRSYSQHPVGRMPESKAGNISQNRRKGDIMYGNNIFAGYGASTTC